MKILKNWGIQSKFLIFLFSLWLWIIWSIIVNSATEQTILKRGWHNIYGWSNFLARSPWVLEGLQTLPFWLLQSGFKKNTWRPKKCEEGTLKWNMENVPKGHIIHSILNNIWTVNSKYRTTTDHSRSHMKSHARYNLNIIVQCEMEVLSRNHSKRHRKTISG